MEKSFLRISHGCLPLVYLPLTDQPPSIPSSLWLGTDWGTLTFRRVTLFCCLCLCSLNFAVSVYVPSTLLSLSMFPQLCCLCLCSLNFAVSVYVPSTLLSLSMFPQLCCLCLCSLNFAHEVGMAYGRQKRSQLTIISSTVTFFNELWMTKGHTLALWMTLWMAKREWQLWS